MFRILKIYFLMVFFVIVQIFYPSEAISFSETGILKNSDEIRKVLLPEAGGKKGGVIGAVKKSIDIQINFDFDSATIKHSSIPQLMEIGKALVSRGLNGNEIGITGHTDAKGSDSYNHYLSKRRALSVKYFLLDRFRINSKSLKVSGAGENQLKDYHNPYSSVNRRVEITNYGR